jgi:hypothetical protein
MTAARSCRARQTRPAQPIGRPEPRFQHKQSVFKSAQIVTPNELRDLLRALPQRNGALARVCVRVDMVMCALVLMWV